MFGMTNATITAHYAVQTLTKDIYATPELQNPATPNHKVWLEEVKTEVRATQGDTHTKTATVIADLLEGIAEGDIIEITPDSLAGEAPATAQKWRITSFDQPNSFVHSGSRIRRMELTVTLFAD